MATSYVGFIDKGFWTHDVFLEGLSYLLAREFNKINEKQNWQFILIENWTIASTVGFVGCVPSYFDQFDTHDKVQLLRDTLCNILRELKVNPDFVTTSELNHNYIGRKEWENIEVSSFINITQLTLDLIDGRLKTNASSPIDYWNID